jgi:sigma-E factor negative regulatory protein RseB
LKRQAAWVMVLALIGLAQAQVAGPTPGVGLVAATGPQSIEQWLTPLRGVAQQRSYVGTFVVTTGQYMSSARVWHVCEGTQQIERVDALTGVARSTYRRNDQVVSYLPQSKTAMAQKRESLGIFTDVLNRADPSIAQFYQLKSLGHDQVAGFSADVIQLVPRDGWRFGYRIWTEKTTGLVLKLQTLDRLQLVLEQAVFTELQLAQPISWAKLSAMMDNSEGYLVKKPELIATAADQEGWQLKAKVPGFKPLSCQRRQDGGPIVSRGPLQCVFSDGLASVSIFIEAFDPANHGKHRAHEQFAMGATHMHMRRLDDWWITVVGEVPQQTLQKFAQSLERKK